MQTKLTLSVDNSVLIPFKDLAYQEQTSVSRIVENYMRRILALTTNIKKTSSHPITDSLSGMMKSTGPIDEKKIKLERLMDKYL